MSCNFKRLKKGRFVMKEKNNRGMLTLLSVMMVCVMALVGSSVGGLLGGKTPAAYAETTGAQAPS